MKKQAGLSFFGFIFIAMAVAMALITAFKVVPTYIEYFNIKQAVATVVNQNSGAAPAVIRNSYSKHVEISDIDSVSPQDLLVTQVGGTTTVRADYEKVVPLVGNVSLLFQFEVESSTGSSN
ncbi:DUF4845 domain-containing protein [Chitinibacter sp. GC72]|uniref:DUF4845 domain-containing protein n=1 Tax=Chitinibacter sp. GC72 TaxID=1526917 RepID=UPI0012FA0E10|nr:DUF4845 domain-containing protein [Chitinibacter sp. GC72]